jgi:hypothetical protein
LLGEPKLDLPDARAILAELTARQVKLNLGGSVHDPTDPVGRLLFNMPAVLGSTRRRLAVELVGEVRRLDQRIRATGEQILAAVKESGTSLTELFGVAGMLAGKILVGRIGASVRVGGGVRVLHRHGSDRGVLW